MYEKVKISLKSRRKKRSIFLLKKGQIYPQKGSILPLKRALKGPKELNS